MIEFDPANISARLGLAPFLTELSPKDRRFNHWKTLSLQFAQMLEAALSDREFRFDRDKFLAWYHRAKDCGSFLRFRNSWEGFKLKEANFCKHRLCPMCARRRSQMWGAKVTEILPKMDLHQENLIFLTLTVQNFPVVEIAKRKKWLSDSVNRLLQKLRDRKLIRGYIRGFEITRPDRDEMCHPHYHLLIAVKPEYFSSKFYCQHFQWVRDWRNAAKLDYDPSVRIRKVKTVGKSIIETVKYELKPDDYTGNWRWTARLAISNQNTQRVSTGGIFRENLRMLEYDPDYVHEADRELGFFPGSRNQKIFDFVWDAKICQYILSNYQGG